MEEVTPIDVFDESMMWKFGIVIALLVVFLFLRFFLRWMNQRQSERSKTMWDEIEKQHHKPDTNRSSKDGNHD